MRIGRVAGPVLGMLTLAPIVYLVIFLTVIGPKLFSFGSPSGVSHTEFAHLLGTASILHLSVLILTLGLVTFYVALVHRSDLVPLDKRSLWTFLLFFGNIFVMPVFWYLFVWNSRR